MQRNTNRVYFQEELSGSPGVSVLIEPTEQKHNTSTYKYTYLIGIHIIS